MLPAEHPDPHRPTDPRPAIVRPYAPPDRPWESGHRGVDLAADPRAPVRSLTAGIVGVAGPVAGKPVVTVLLGGGRRVTYEPVIATVSPGDRVQRGQVIGTVAATGGHCGADAGCLHLGLRTDSAYLDPSILLARAVLKPTRRPAPGARADGGG